MNSTPHEPVSGLSRIVGPLRFGASAAAVAYAIRSLTHGHYVLAALMLVLALATVLVPEVMERMRRRAVYRSGNVREILHTALLETNADSENSVALKRALAFAALGVTGPARLALQTRPRRPLSDDEREELLIVETLVEAFDGEHTNATRRVAALGLLPVPTGGGERRARAVRQCLGAMVRAFDGRSEQDVLEILVRGPEVFPILYWATRYAAAAVCAQRGARDAVQTLLAEAPTWPDDSAFSLLHRDLLGDLEEPAARRVA